MITDTLGELVRKAVAAATAEGKLASDGEFTIEFERPKRREHGDFATNVALQLAQGKNNPRAVAEAIKTHLPESDFVAGVEVAGPGFLNFRLAPGWLHDVVRTAGARPGFGRSETGGGRTVNVEYVSANPTGPISVVSGRHAAYGDALGNLLEATGHRVTREFYINDAGRQAILFGQSVSARYLQELGREASVPEDGYQGEYVVDLAKEIVSEVGDRYLEVEAEERETALRAAGIARMIERMKSSLERFGTRYDLWFSEHDLHDRGEIDAAVEKLRAAGDVYENESALWFSASKYGDDKDRVLIRSNGEPTYIAADAAYLLDKFERGFDHLIYVWGSDHHGTVPRLLAAATSLGFNPQRVEIRLVQVVTLARKGETLKGSKRKGVIVALEELLDEVGVDPARYTFLTRSIDAPLDFDIELVKQQAPENPVYYVQYAHARICSILRKAQEDGVTADVETAPLDLLVHPSEEQLLRKLAAYEEAVVDATELRAPQRITRFVEELASDFSAFYRDCRVMSEDVQLTQARLAVCVATRNVIAGGLGLLGVGAPERM